MKTLHHALWLCIAAAANVPAQNTLELPATAGPGGELPNYALHPLMQSNSRVQMFYDATEVGASSFTADQIQLRYDGPLPQVGYPGPFAIQRLQVRIGTSTVVTPGARFADNLTQPLTTVVDGPWTYFPDPGTVLPHPWGAPNDSLTFTFTTPVPISIPAGGWLVVELVMEGNNIANFGFAHALLDGAATTGGPADGSGLNFGQGCALQGQPAPTIGSTGVRAPGAAFFLTGQNLGAGAPVFAIFGLSDTTSSFGPLPFQLPGTGCNFYSSTESYALVFADAGGTLEAQPGTALAVPADNGFAGLVLFSQLAAYAPGANAFDVVLSDGLETTLGSLLPAGRGTWAVSHGASAVAPIATDVEAFGYAVRLRTL